MDNKNLNEIQGLFKKGHWKSILIVVGIIILLFAFKPWAQIGAGERGIILNFGAVQEVVLGEGLHFIIPVVQKVTLMDVNTL